MLKVLVEISVVIGLPMMFGLCYPSYDIPSYCMGLFMGLCIVVLSKMK